MKVFIPKEVADALDFHREELWKHLDQNTVDHMLMYIPSSLNVTEQTLILKKFANENPSTYLQAIANGYEPIRDLKEEVAQMLSDWMNTGYVEDEQTDIKNFANLVTDYIQQQTL